MVSVLSVSAFADFSTTDSNHLTTLYTRSAVWSTAAEAIVDIYHECINMDNKLNWLDDIADYTADAADRLYDYQHSKSAAQLLYSINEALHDNNTSGYVLTAAEWLNMINAKNTTGGLSTAQWLQKISDDRLVSGGNSVANWTDLINSKVLSIKNDVGRIEDIITAEKEKQDDALDDYSSSGGRSASDTSSDVGAISGSLSNSFNSGVSASSALNAVDDNQSDFEYFFFGMKNDLNTAGGGGGAKKAPRRDNPDSGNYVPDFLSDYWGGLNG